MAHKLFGRLNPLPLVKSVRLSYSPQSHQPTRAIKELIMDLNCEEVRSRYPHLKVEWEILAYDSPPVVEWKLFNGETHRSLYNHFTEDERKEMLYRHGIKASLSPHPNTQAPEFPPNTRTQTKMTEIHESLEKADHDEQMQRRFHLGMKRHGKDGGTDGRPKYRGWANWRPVWYPPIPEPQGDAPTDKGSKEGTG